MQHVGGCFVRLLLALILVSASLVLHADAGASTYLWTQHRQRMTTVSPTIAWPALTTHAHITTGMWAVGSLWWCGPYAACASAG